MSYRGSLPPPWTGIFFSTPPNYNWKKNKWLSSITDIKKNNRWALLHGSLGHEVPITLCKDQRPERRLREVVTGFHLCGYPDALEKTTFILPGRTWKNMRMLYEQVPWRALESKIAIQILSEIILQSLHRHMLWVPRWSCVQSDSGLRAPES